MSKTVFLGCTHDGGSTERQSVSMSLEYQTEETREEFKVTNHWDSTAHGEISNGQVFVDFDHLQQTSRSKGNIKGGGDSYPYNSRQIPGGRKVGKKR